MLETYIIDLKASKNKLNDFDEGLFYALVDRVKVNKDRITIIWKDGTDTKKDINEVLYIAGELFRYSDGKSVKLLM